MTMAKRIISILWAVALCALVLAPAATPVVAGQLDKMLQAKADFGSTPEMVSVILQTSGPPTESDQALVRAFGGNPGAPFSTIRGFAAQVPSPALKGLAHNPRFEAVSFDAPMQVFWDTNSASAVVGSPEAASLYGADGKGVGVAVIDSGITSNHSDLRNGASLYNAVASFNDFVLLGSRTVTDPYGHGSHVAGLVAGNGSLVSQFAGTAPAASLHILRVLDGNGRGSVSGVLAAFDWVQRAASMFNIRVVNLSLGHPVYESHTSDPLCRGVQDLASRGIVVVAAAGNYGRSQDGMTVYGSIVSPGNSPYALTVGAMNPRGTASRIDDTIAAFSSRGPTAIDNHVKPDVVAPGVFLGSLHSSGSYFASVYSDLKLDTTLYGLGVGADDYFLMSGTSMAAPVVSGIVATMLQKNPALTPNLVKAILQYTAENRGYDVMTQGAGYVNAVGAVEVASKIALDYSSYGDGQYMLTAPLSGASTINGEGVTWTGLAVWDYALIWGGISYNFESMYSLGVYWGVQALLSDDDFLASGVQSNALIWTGIPLDAFSVTWTGFNGLTSDDIVYGEGFQWGGGKHK